MGGKKKKKAKSALTGIEFVAQETALKGEVHHHLRIQEQNRNHYTASFSACTTPALCAYLCRMPFSCGITPFIAA